MKILLKFLLLTLLISNLQSDNSGEATFPDDFIFGAATSAYQIEGAWNDSGKDENIWDRFTHTQPDMIEDNSSGDIACDSYHKIQEDVALLKNLGVHFYRFSLSWSRILLSPFRGKVNEDGILYYNDLINLLLKNNIQPLVTLYHWDLPQSLQNLGGFTNSILIEYFVMYAKIAFENFGDRVKLWMTFNQPKTFCLFGYGNGTLAPAINLSGIADYLCAHNVLKAHAEVYHLYNDTFKPTQKGRLSITLNSEWFEPFSNAREDIDAATRALQFSLGWFAHPIYTKLGNYPSVMIQNIEEHSKARNFARSRLPRFTNEEIERIKGTSDFFGFNHYRTFLAANQQSAYVLLSFFKDQNVEQSQDSAWPATVVNINKVVPWGFSKILKWIKEQYGNPEIYVTENGYPDTGELEDRERINYFQLYLSALLESIHKDGVRVKAYTAWSLLDNFEWSSGYSVKYGLHHVDFASPNRTRTPKASAEYFKQVIASRKP